MITINSVLKGNNRKAHFFKGSEYIRYDMAMDRDEDRQRRR